MIKNVKNFIKYFILLIVFIILIELKSLDRLHFSMLLIFMALNQSAKYFEEKSLKLTVLTIIEIIISIYLSSISFNIYLLLSLLILADTIEYSKVKSIILINAIYLLYSGYYLYRSFTYEYLISFILLYAMSIYVGSINRENRNRKVLEDRINELEYEHRVKDIENERKDRILKDIYITKERNRISRDIHDSVGHSISAMIIQLSAIEQIAKVDGEKASKLSGELRDYAVKSMDDIRGVLKNTRPKDSIDNELIVMIENLIEENMKLTNMDIKFKFSANRYSLDYSVEKLIYNGVKEFISNSIKHGQANRIDINLFYKENELVLSMKDDGIGTDNIVKGMGLRAIGERVRENNGDLVVRSSYGEGFFLSIIIGR